MHGKESPKIIYFYNNVTVIEPCGKIDEYKQLNKPVSFKIHRQYCEIICMRSGTSDTIS
jgi:hypothetical protein